MFLAPLWRHTFTARPFPASANTAPTKTGAHMVGQPLRFNQRATEARRVQQPHSNHDHLALYKRALHRQTAVWQWAHSPRFSVRHPPLEDRIATLREMVVTRAANAPYPPKALSGCNEHVISARVFLTWPRAAYSKGRILCTLQTVARELALVTKNCNS